MKNKIRSQGRIWHRRSKNLTSGEILCPRCGAWKRVSKFTDKHFTEEHSCRTCKRELREIQIKVKPIKVKKAKAQFPKDCPHRPFFWCKTPKACVGCYYNPDKKFALAARFDDDDEKKKAKTHWFYGNKRHAKASLKMLDDIKHGRGLFENGRQHHFRYARKNGNNR